MRFETRFDRLGSAMDGGFYMGQNGNMTAGARSLAILLGVTMCAGAQDALVREPAAGRYLVAQRDLLDPNFSETVILLVHYSEKEAMGLVVNRPTKVTVSRLFQEMEEARGRRDPVYLGGPVAVNGVVALLRSSKDPAEGAEHVTEDVYLISSEGTLKKAIERGAEASEFRILLGYAGWGPRQPTELWSTIESDSWRFIHPAGILYPAGIRPASTCASRRASTGAVC